MARSDTLEPEIVPYDDGELAERSRIKALLGRVRAKSPRTVLGAPLIKKLASELNRKRESGLQEVTQMRLALRMRQLDWVAMNLLPGSAQPRSSCSEPVKCLERSSRNTMPPPNATTAKKAKRTLCQAASAIDQIEAKLSSPEVAAFSKLNVEVLASMKHEVKRIEELAVPAYGMRRGHPSVAFVVTALHAIFRDLTGSSLRDWSDHDTPDRFLTDALADVVRELAPAEYSDEDIGTAIETAIKKRTGKKISKA